MTDHVSLKAVLFNLADETRVLQKRLADVEQAVLDQTEHATSAPKPLQLQDMDLIAQGIDDLASGLVAMAEEVNDTVSLAPGQILPHLKLERTRRCFDEQAEFTPDQSGDVVMF